MAGLQTRPSLRSVPFSAPTFLSSCSCTSSHSACAIALSFASFSSATVLNPFSEACSAILPAFTAPDAHPSMIPCVCRILRVVASAMTARTSTPDGTYEPPSLWPEPLVRTLRWTAAVWACRRISCIGIRRPPSRWPSPRNPSPVYPLRTSSSCSSRRASQRAWNASLCGPWTLWQSSWSMVSTTSSMGRKRLLSRG